MNKSTLQNKDRNKTVKLVDVRVTEVEKKTF